eukprot:412829-Amphidinium_carterae.1
MDQDETEELAMMTSAAAAAMASDQEHSTVMYTSSSGERSRQRGSTLRAKSDGASKVTPRASRKVKGNEVKLPLNVRVGRTSSRLREGPQVDAMEAQLRFAESAYQELGLRAARELSVKTAELAATSAQVEQQNIALQSSTTELNNTQQRMKQMQAEAIERVTVAERKATTVETVSQGEIEKLRGELMAVSSTA